MPHRRTRGPGPSSLTVEVSYHSWVAVIAVHGDVDSSTVARLRAAVDEVADTGHDLLLDLTHCPFLDSSGISQVLRAQQLARLQDAAFCVVCQDGSVPARVLEIVCAGAIPVHQARPDALAALRRAASDADDPLGGAAETTGSA